ncbi:hypothetical protein NECAME_07920 [Necator americanus]|uniref:Mitochondrial fission factor n=1 Tax=Necator americanus TaxID=51031 RepID=W2TLM8_NECAM|nr:hypothetical protein NECAME_07920 [Necator americanus]ETN82534.1 hypothetical protein NECAME_07920 [Necator americanus]
MIVPEHISVTGEALKSVGLDNHGVVDRERLMQMMNVPDRIVLTGGDGYKGYEAEPLDVMNDHITQVGENDLKDLPNKITMRESPYLDRGDPADEPVRSENSIAIEENPLQELKLMRRQIGRISTRLYQLEDEIEQRRFRDKCQRFVKKYYASETAFADLIVLNPKIC